MAVQYRCPCHRLHALWHSIRDRCVLGNWAISVIDSALTYLAQVAAALELGHMSAGGITRHTSPRRKLQQCGAMA